MLHRWTLEQAGGKAVGDANGATGNKVNQTSQRNTSGSSRGSKSSLHDDSMQARDLQQLAERMPQRGEWKKMERAAKELHGAAGEVLEFQYIPHCIWVHMFPVVVASTTWQHQHTLC
jgi:hypothetical protein